MNAQKVITLIMLQKSVSNARRNVVNALAVMFVGILKAIVWILGVVRDSFLTGISVRIAFFFVTAVLKLQKIVYSV